ncbi:hypothetical protein VTK73DRAFT_10416 [Phialemonium thermophilum]|uniref:Uncharacterized protein n=1 Tax=Phialemonium thermophilum TaxID=223376 RepID=A0ABR3VWU5_9PEZI
MVLLKRKRSESELSVSSGSAFSSPPRPESRGLFDFVNMDAAHHADGPRLYASPPSSSSSFSSRSGTPSHLPSRTRKRFRNGRPSDEEVHQRTLHLLYSAQHHQPRAHDHQVAGSHHPTAAVPPPAPSTVYHQTPSCSAPSQRSLHSFWNLPAHSSSSSSSSSSPSPLRSLMPPCSAPSSASLMTGGLFDGAGQCEDCGTGLYSGSEADGDAMMDVDGSCGPGLVDGGFCTVCGKTVCGSCSVSNLGEQRRCLVCAGRKVWVGGIGWATAGGARVGVC